MSPQSKDAALVTLNIGIGHRHYHIIVWWKAFYSRKLAWIKIFNRQDSRRLAYLRKLSRCRTQLILWKHQRCRRYLIGCHRSKDISVWINCVWGIGRCSCLRSHNFTVATFSAQSMSISIDNRFLKKALILTLCLKVLKVVEFSDLLPNLQK